MKKRNAVIIVLASLFVVVMSIGITLAYLSDKKEVENSIYITEGNVSIIESFPTVSEQHMENSFTKEVKVKKNDGNEVSWSVFKTTPSTDWEYVAEGASGYDAKMQGYFYYKKVVPVNGETSLLIKGVNVDYNGDNNTDSNIDKIQDFEMIVYTETVQTTEIDASGTVYNDDKWKKAWESFLKVPTT